MISKQTQNQLLDTMARKIRNVIKFFLISKSATLVATYNTKFYIRLRIYVTFQLKHFSANLFLLCKVKWYRWFLNIFPNLLSGCVARSSSSPPSFLKRIGTPACAVKIIIKNSWWKMEIKRTDFQTRQDCLQLKIRRFTCIEYPKCTFGELARWTKSSTYSCFEITPAS